MKTAEEYHAQYPIGSQWLLPVTICAHATPDYPDTWDPRPIQIKPTTGKHYHRLWPHIDTLATLQPAGSPPAAEPYSVVHSKAHAAWCIYGPYALSCTHYFYGEHYPYTVETAKAAAEAECARLNAQHNKNQTTK